MNDEKALSPVLTMDAPERTLDVVTLEIQTLQRQAIEVNLMYAIEIGRRLTEAKAMLPHGQWGDYLKIQVSYSQSTANNLMRIFREYGDNQQSLFGKIPNVCEFALLQSPPFAGHPRRGGTGAVRGGP